MKEVEELIQATKEELSEASIFAYHPKARNYNVYVGTKTSIENILYKIKVQNIDINLENNLFYEVKEPAPAGLTHITDDKIKFILLKRMHIYFT